MPIGYDSLPVNFGLLLDLQFREGTGALTHDWAQPHHQDVALVNTPTWDASASSGTGYLDFDSASHEYLNLPAVDSGDLDFTSGDFSGAAWINSAATGTRYIFNKRPAADTSGWNFSIEPSGVATLTFRTVQAADSQETVSDVFALNAWHLVGFSRDRASARVYVDGVDKTAAAATHIDPVSAVATALTIGASEAGGSGWFDGCIWRPRIWGRALAAGEHLAIFEYERDLWGA